MHWHWKCADRVSTGSHLLAQVPLTVSPFTQLPKAPTLPHNYTSLPSTLPPSCIYHTTTTTAASHDSNDQTSLPAYVTSSSGFTAHPSQIIAQNRALLFQLKDAAVSAKESVQEWERSIRDRELAEKRRRAPGWLDREEKILEPEKTVGGALDQDPEFTIPEQGVLEPETNEDRKGASEQQGGTLRGGDPGGADLGAQMDRAFGSLG